MALVDCPDCGTSVSDAAVQCPQCGRPNPGAAIAESNSAPVPPPLPRKPWSGSMVGAIVLIGALLAGMVANQVSGAATYSAFLDRQQRIFCPHPGSIMVGARSSRLCACAVARDREYRGTLGGPWRFSPIYLELVDALPSNNNYLSRHYPPCRSITGEL